MTHPAPHRIQRKRTKGWKLPEGTVVVDRSTKFGNPFPVSKGTATKMGVVKDIWAVGTWTGPNMWFCDTKADAVELSVKAYSAWINASHNAPLRFRAQSLLRGKNLACWCALDQPCHADDPDCRCCDVAASETPRGRWLNLDGGHGFHGERVVRMNRVGKHRDGRTLDGREHKAFPK